MRATHIYTLGMSAGGLIMLMVGIGHIFLPTLGYSPDIVAQFEPRLANHFYYLATYALCALFLTQGSLSLWLARQTPSLPTLGVAAALAAWWWWRLYLEIRYPVEIPLFGIDEPTHVLTPVLTLTASAYTAALLAAINCLRPKALRTTA